MRPFPHRAVGAWGSVQMMQHPVCAVIGPEPEPWGETPSNKGSRRRLFSTKSPSKKVPIVTASYAEKTDPSIFIVRRGVKLFFVQGGEINGLHASISIGRIAGYDEGV